MDSLAEPKATEYERRASRRISGISIHNGAAPVCDECSGREDLVVADGFHTSIGSDTGTSDEELATHSTPTSSSSTTDEANTEPEIGVENEVVSESEVVVESDAGAAVANPSQGEPEASPVTPDSLQPPIVRDRPRSIAKPPEPADSFALRHDGAISSTPDIAATVDRNSHPSSAPGSEPATPSGPSFPYDVYAQAISLARTMSANTITTAPASPIAEYPPTPTSPLGPSHPYGMYPQITAAGPSNIPLHGPVGFQGMPDNYQRRVGPGGEVLGDMIGLDGHTEQLPPYSRYPDEASIRKARDVAASSTNALAGPSANPSLNSIINPNPTPLQPTNDTLEQPQSPAFPTFASGELSDAATPSVERDSPTLDSTGATPADPAVGAGGIGLATRDPEFDSDNAQESSESQHSSRSFTSESENSGQRINRGGNGSAGSADSNGQPNQETTSEKEAPAEETRRKRLQQYARRRLWGIVPYWAICFFVTLLVFIGIVAGAVVGTFLEGKNKRPPPKPPSKHGGSYSSGTVSGPPIVSVTVDASPIPTPTDLPPLATGSFSLPLGLNKSPASCFNDSTQSPSWSCGIWFGSGMTITIEQTNALPRLGSRTGRFGARGTSPGYSVALSCNQTSIITGNTFWYGQQPPAIPSPLPLEMVNDIADPSRGPAWFKLVPYDKTVIVQQSMLTTRASAGAAPAATPTMGTSNEEAEKRRRSKVARAYGGPPGDFHRKGLAGVGDKPWVCTWPDTVLEVFIYPQQNTSWTKYAQGGGQGSSVSSSSSSSSSSSQPSSSSNPIPSALSATGVESSTKGQSPTSSEPTATTSSSSSTASPGAPFNTGTWVPPYPRVVKVVERRMARARQAYCRQYEIKPEGNSQPLLDPNGDFVEFNISEEETGPAMAYGNGGDSSAQRRWTEADDGEGSRENMLLGTRATGSDLSDCGCLWMLT